MSAASSVHAPSADGSRLQTYLRWAAPPNFVAALTIFVLWRYYATPLFLAMAIAVFVNGLVSFKVYRLAGEGRLDDAITWLCAGLWLVALGLSIGGMEFFAVTMMCALLPVLAAFPYVSLDRLLGLGLAATTIVGVAAAIAISGVGTAPDPLPSEWLRLFLAVGITVLISVFGLSMWQNRSTLSRETDRMLAANAALRKSEQTLEARVRERTEELERADRDLEAMLDRALKANEQKSAFLSSMSHELRTPLNAIIGFSEVLYDRIFGELNEKQSEYIKDIHDSGHHLLSLINDILDLSSVESGRLTLRSVEFDLVGTLDDALVFTRERAMRRGINLSREVERDLGRVVGDELKIKQVVINLLTNAVKFTPRGGTVTLHAERSSEMFSVWVSDTGVGIPQADHQRIFEDYGQASAQHPSSQDTSRMQATEQEGTGLGLALSKRLVELHGGRLEVESRVAVGSTFRFSIPLLIPEPASHPSMPRGEE